MASPHIGDRVRLTQDIPQLELHRGASGVVRSTWFAPSIAYEVEFDTHTTTACSRALLVADQVDLQTDERKQDLLSGL